MIAAPYLGTGSLAGLTTRQVAAIEAACSNAPAQLHDGLWRAIALNLGDVPTTDTIVQSAIHAALFDNNITTSFLLPHPSATTAGLNGNITVGANATQRQLLKSAVAASGSFGADIVKA